MINSSRSNSAVLPSKWRPWPVTVMAGSLSAPSSHKSKSIILSGMLPHASGIVQLHPVRCHTDTENLDKKMPSDTAFCV